MSEHELVRMATNYGNYARILAEVDDAMNARYYSIARRKFEKLTAAMLEDLNEAEANHLAEGEG
mgnify:CR=1 FL=1|tara:strand:- start:143 stop:334 length:192 start_codon:yes stop_codon:yes gene_type:complete